MTEFEKVIKAHLDELAKSDKLFAETYKKENKSIKECCAWIISEAKKKQASGVASIPDDEVYGMAVHYYDEGDIKVKEPVKAKVATPTPKKTEQKEDAEEFEFKPIKLNIPLFQ